jgi:isopenicillin-N epimerase
MDDSFWATARAQMLLDPTVANLNTGSFGPLPRPVFDHVTDLRRQLAEEPMRFLLRTAPSWLWYARKRLSEFVGADPRRLVFTANVTAAINVVASSLRLESPGEILLTDHEYGAMVWCWERAASRLGLVVRTFPLPLRPRRAQDVVDAACAAMTRRTRLFFFSHVLSPTGMILPARELCAAAHARNIPTVVDGAHAPAFVPNLRLDEIGADFYGANCHKWLLAPTGAGFLYLGSSAGWDLLQPLQVSWGWQKDSCRGLDGEDEFGSTPHIRHLEFEGTRDPCAWLAVPTAIDFQRRIGWRSIRARIDELVRHVRARLGDELGLDRVTPGLPHLRGPMTAFRLPPGASAPELRHRLWHDHQVEAPIIERPDGLLIRVSTHFYNTEEEVDRLAVALRCLCRS